MKGGINGRRVRGGGYVEQEEKTLERSPPCALQLAHAAHDSNVTRFRHKVKRRGLIISRNDKSATAHLRVQPQDRARIQIPQRAQMNSIQRHTINSLGRSGLRSHCRIVNIAQVNSKNAFPQVPRGHPVSTVG